MIPAPGIYWLAGSYTNRATLAPARMGWRLVTVTDSHIIEWGHGKTARARWLANPGPLPDVWVAVAPPAFDPDSPPGSSPPPARVQPTGWRADSRGLPGPHSPALAPVPPLPRLDGWRAGIPAP